MLIFANEAKKRKKKYTIQSNKMQMQYTTTQRNATPQHKSHHIATQLNAIYLSSDGILIQNSTKEYSTKNRFIDFLL